jgi:hypothetical protein
MCCACCGRALRAVGCVILGGLLSCLTITTRLTFCINVSTCRRNRRHQVTFSLHRRADLGDAWKLVGPAPELGRWIPDVARRMAWAEGDQWSVAVRLPPGEHAFKAALRAADGTTTWEAGPDRAVIVPAGGGALSVSLDVRMPWEVTAEQAAAPSPAVVVPQAAAAPATEPAAEPAAGPATPAGHAHEAQTRSGDSGRIVIDTYA